MEETVAAVNAHIESTQQQFFGPPNVDSSSEIGPPSQAGDWEIKIFPEAVVHESAEGTQDLPATAVASQSPPAAGQSQQQLVLEEQVGRERPQDVASTEAACPRDEMPLPGMPLPTMSSTQSESEKSSGMS